MRAAILCALFAAVAGQPAAADYFWREPAFADVAIRGPAAVHGALLYNQGRGISVAGQGRAGDSYHLPPPPYVRTLLAAGWDGFRLNRKWAADNESSAIAALHEEIRRLRAEGYNRIVLAGQSYGAWLSVLAATKDNDLHAIIATAPGTGYGGESVDGTTLNAQKLVDYADDLKRTRAAMFFFDGDPRDVAWLKRGERVKRVLEKRGIPHFIVDRPLGFHGHGGAGGSLFAFRFGSCLVTFISPSTSPETPPCDAQQSLADFLFKTAKMDRASLPANAPERLTPFVGHWLGEYTDAIRLLVPTEIISPTQLRAAYGGAALGSEGAKPYARQTVIATLEGERLTYRIGDIAYGYQVRADGNLDGEWRRVNGSGSGKAVFRRLP